jgi:hypothetical protein
MNVIEFVYNLMVYPYRVSLVCPYHILYLVCLYRIYHISLLNACLARRCVLVSAMGWSYLFKREILQHVHDAAYWRVRSNFYAETNY